MQLRTNKTRRIIKVLRVWLKPLGTTAELTEASTEDDCSGALRQAEVGNEH